MFGSEIVSTVLYTELSALPAAASFAGRIVGAPVLPQKIALPAVLFSPEFSAYSDPMGGGARQPGGITYEQLRFSVRVLCAGLSTDPVLALATAQLAHFDGAAFNTTVDSVSYQLTFMAQGEVPVTTIVDGANVYRQLGTVYTVELVTGG